jgi:hypothetical protein
MHWLKDYCVDSITFSIKDTYITNSVIQHQNYKIKDHIQSYHIISVQYLSIAIVQATIISALKYIKNYYIHVSHSY